MDRPARRPGPPVDAARLQPDNQGDIHRVDEGLVGAWLDDPDLAAELADELEQLERLRRLQADEELLLALQPRVGGGHAVGDSGSIECGKPGGERVDEVLEPVARRDQVNPFGIGDGPQGGIESYQQGGKTAHLGCGHVSEVNEVAPGGDAQSASDGGGWITGNDEPPLVGGDDTPERLGRLATDRSAVRTLRCHDFPLRLARARTRPPGHTHLLSTSILSPDDMTVADIAKR